MGAGNCLRVARGLRTKVHILVARLRSGGIADTLLFRGVALISDFNAALRAFGMFTSRSSNPGLGSGYRVGRRPRW